MFGGSDGWLFFFFFSSRRRHTRYWRDWSSDVCSSDLGVSRPTVIAWRKRYAREGLTVQLADRPRRGRPQTVRRTRRAEILATTLAPPPEHLGVTHWSSRLLATELGLSHSTVARVWPSMTSSPGRPRPSSSPPTRSSRRESATW